MSIEITSDEWREMAVNKIKKLEAEIEQHKLSHGIMESHYKREIAELDRKLGMHKNINDDAVREIAELRVDIEEKQKTCEMLEKMVHAEKARWKKMEQRIEKLPRYVHNEFQRNTRIVIDLNDIKNLMQELDSGGEVSEGMFTLICAKCGNAETFDSKLSGNDITLKGWKPKSESKKVVKP